MISTYKHKNTVWIDLESPSAKEIRQVAEKYSLDPNIANDLLTPSYRPYVDVHKDNIYLILHFPIVSDKIDSANENRFHEIDFVIGKDYLITNRYEPYSSILEFSKVFEVDSILDKSNMSMNGGFIFFYMLKHLYLNLYNKLEALKEKIKSAEDEIFSGNERQMVWEFSHLNRQLINFKAAFSMHHDVLKNLLQASDEFFGPEFKYYAKTIIGEYLKVKNEIVSVKDYLDELRETNNSLLSTKQNEIMKTLTVITFLVLPLSLIANLFGMNAISTPIIGSGNDFGIIIIIMAIFSLFTYGVIKYNKWL